MPDVERLCCCTCRCKGSGVSERHAHAQCTNMERRLPCGPVLSLEYLSLGGMSVGTKAAYCAVRACCLRAHSCAKCPRCGRVRSCCWCLRATDHGHRHRFYQTPRDCQHPTQYCTRAGCRCVPGTFPKLAPQEALPRFTKLLEPTLRREPRLCHGRQRLLQKYHRT